MVKTFKSALDPETPTKFNHITGSVSYTIDMTANIINMVVVSSLWINSK